MEHIISLVGSNNKYIPIVWQSKHIKGVVKSTLVAETLESNLFYWNLLLELLQLIDKTETIKIICKTVNSSLHDSKDP